MSSLFGLRVKIIAVFGASLVLAWITAAFLARAAYYIGVADRSTTIYAVLNWFRHNVGVANVALLAGIALFIIFVFLLSRGGIAYMEQMSRTLQQVSLGRLDLEVPPRPNDELGELGANINRMTRRLQGALEQERRTAHARHDLITSVSHDLRTPLTSILGYLELLAKPGGTAATEAQHYADVALQKARQLTGRVDSLFEFAKVSDGGFSIRPAPIDLRELLAQLVDELVPAFQANGLECRMSAPSGRWPVLADGDLLVRVFENLLSNAMRHGRAGGHVDVQLSRAGQRAVARVVNYGEPIPAEALPHVFDRFYRADQSRSGRTGGAGLGLAIARRIVELHGGEISVTSDAAGTAFQVAIPLAVGGSPDS